MSDRPSRDDTVPLAGSTMTMTTVTIGERVVGDTQPCYVIAEAGSNHGGRLEQARCLIDVAADAGADAVKFQIFRAERLYPRSAGVSEYLGLRKAIYDVIADLEVPFAWIPDLAAHCDKRGVQFVASAFDEQSVDALDPYVPAFKIASYEMTHHPLLSYTAGKGKPVIVSTGTATIEEVAEAVGVFRAAGNQGLVLMQCTAAYPAPPESLNVRAIVTLKAQFGVPVGFSDHSRDPVVGPAAAVSVGANLIEKHFTLSNRLPGPDHQFALEPRELARMVRRIRETERVLGDGRKVVQAVEAELRQFARRSVFTLVPVACGDVFTPANLGVLRCGSLQSGVAPARYREVLGRRAARNLPAEHAIQPDDYV